VGRRHARTAIAARLCAKPSCPGAARRRWASCSSFRPRARLRAIRATRGEAFYGGEIAQAIAAFAQAHGGSLSLADLAAYQPEWVTPIAKDYRGYTLHEIPPNGQGIAALIALGILEQFDLASLPVDGVGRSTCRSRP
jgi:gamma-glutamyltranspeptidase